MTVIESNLTILLFSMVIFLVSLSVFNTVFSKIKKVPFINAQNNNVASSEIDFWIVKLKEKLQIEEFNVLYRESYKYTNFINIVNFKSKTITIPKWDFNSVGYEIDYLFALMWSASLSIKKDKLIKWISIRLVYLLFLLKLLFLTVVIFQCVYWYASSHKTTNFYLVNLDLFYWYDNYYIIQMFGIASFLIIVVIYISDFRVKNIIEHRYEIFIKSFVEEHATKYLDDLIAARAYSISNARLNITTIYLFNKTTNKLSYFSPFTFQ